MQTIHCPICGPNNDFKVRYPANFDKSLLRFTARNTPDHMRFRTLQCKGCGLIYSSPILSEHEIIDLYRQSRFIQEPQLDNMVEDYLYQVDQIIDLVNKENLLEIGCSSGFFLEKAKKYGFKNMYGIEPGKEAVKQAPDDIQKDVHNDVLKQGLFPDEYFDLICFFQIFDHILDPNTFLQLVHKYLKKNGTIIAIHHDIKALMPTILGSKASTYDISHIHLWDKNTMRIILEKNNFKIRYIKNISNRYQLDHIIRMLPLFPLAKRSLRTLFQWIRLSNISIKFNVENMVCVAHKN